MGILRVRRDLNDSLPPPINSAQKADACCFKQRGNPITGRPWQELIREAAIQLRRSVLFMEMNRNTHTEKRHTGPGNQQ